jgi:hypothetical protein
MGNVVGEITGANRRAARAAGGAAQAKEARAGQFFNETQGRVDNMMEAVNDPQALAALESSMQTQERQLVRQEKLMESINPALIEASNQALKLLRGEEAASMGPAKAQREKQKQQLINTLREQLGPGAETSSAGIQAITQFDAETNNLLAGQQQGSLAHLLGVAQGSQQNIAGGAQALSGLAGAGAERQRSAFNAGQSQLFNAMQPLTGASGSRFVEGGLRARQGQGIGSDIFKVGMAAASGGFGGEGLLGPMSGGGNGGGGGSAEGGSGGGTPIFGFNFGSGTP